MRYKEDEWALASIISQGITFGVIARHLSQFPKRNYKYSDCGKLQFPEWRTKICTTPTYGSYRVHLKTKRNFMGALLGECKITLLDRSLLRQAPGSQVDWGIGEFRLVVTCVDLDISFALPTPPKEYRELFEPYLLTQPWSGTLGIIMTPEGKDPSVAWKRTDRAREDGKIWMPNTFCFETLTQYYQAQKAAFAQVDAMNARLTLDAERKACR